MMPGQYLHNRNFGCRISDEFTYRGLRTLVIENELLRISILIDQGTDIFELLYKPRDVDFMWRSPLGVRSQVTHTETIASKNGPFLDFHEGAWQEVFPNGGRTCEVKGAEWGLHGEVWGIPWHCEVVEDSPECVSARCWVRTYRTPFYLEKTLTLRGGCAILEINERVVNEGEEPMDFMWGHHPAFSDAFLDETCVLDVPPNRVVMDLNQAPTSRFAPGQEFDWPVGKSVTGEDVDISRLPPKDSRISDMPYLTNLQEGWFALTNQGRKLGIGMSWDKRVWPHLWWWMAFGGEMGYPSYGRVYTCAVEPFSSWPALLTKSIENNTHHTLGPGEEMTAWLKTVIYEGIERVAGIDEKGTVRPRT